MLTVSHVYVILEVILVLLSFISCAIYAPEDSAVMPKHVL
jgi:hypothetical protein